MLKFASFVAILSAIGCKSTASNPQAAVKDVESVQGAPASGGLCFDARTVTAADASETAAKAALVDFGLTLSDSPRVVVEQNDNASPFYGVFTPFGGRLMELVGQGSFGLRINDLLTKNCAAARPIAAVITTQAAKAATISAPNIWAAAQIDISVLQTLKAGDKFVSPVFFNGTTHDPIATTLMSAQMIISSTAATPVGWISLPFNDAVFFPAGSEFEVVEAKDLPKNFPNDPPMRALKLKHLPAATGGKTLAAAPKVDKSFDKANREAAVKFLRKLFPAGNFEGTYNDAPCSVGVSYNEDRLTVALNPGGSVAFAPKKFKIQSNGKAFDFIPDSYLIRTIESLGRVEINYKSETVPAGAGHQDDNSDHDYLYLDVANGNARTLTLFGSSGKVSRCNLSQPMPFGAL